MSEERVPTPLHWGRVFQRPGVDRYAVHWRQNGEGQQGHLHVRYFVLADDADAMLAYVKQFAADAYAVSVA